MRLWVAAPGMIFGVTGKGWVRTVDRGWGYLCNQNPGYIVGFAGGG